MQEMGKRGRQFLEENLSREHICKGYNDFFLKLLEADNVQDMQHNKKPGAGN